LFNIYGDGFQSISRAISIAHLTKEKLMNVPVIVPPLIEQTAIADFLDTKCEKIDTIIALEETTINELKEYKKTIIQKAITKGISNAPLKNSSIDYLGDIPKQWEIKKFTAIFSLAKGLSITKENLQETGVPVVNYGEIHSKYGRELNPEIHSLKYVKETYLETDKNSLLKYGDFVFADTSEDIEGSGNFTFLNSKEKVFAGYHTIIARPIININYLFLSFLCDSYSFRVQIQSRVAGIKVFSITKGLLKEVTIWLPPISDQQVIEEYLEKKTRQIDKLIKLKQQKITELKEYKKSLIYEYVTGKKQFPKETA
jgi:type I restriction enzyme S subunit